jgi:hypothetical protein
VIVVIAVAVGGVLVWRFRHGHSQSAEPPIGTPKNMLVSFPLQRQPMPGWRTTAADIGLPPGVHVGAMFASNGDQAFFEAPDCGGECRRPDIGFVYGLNMRTGGRLFAPVPMPGFSPAGECHGNGPSVAVCFSYDSSLRPRAWVVDLDRGAVTYAGLTDLPSAGVTDIGEYHGVTRLVDPVNRKGVYGVGSHAEHTWFVPGDGTLVPAGLAAVNEMPPMTLAAQGGGLGKPDRVFSVIDGHDLTPTAPEGDTLDHATVYNGGFAYQFTRGSEAGGVLMYDTSGRLVASKEPTRSYLMKNAAMPTIMDSGKWKVYTADGVLVLEIPATDLVANFKAIGTTLLVQKGSDLNNTEPNPWQQWDLLTGKPAGPSCKFDLDTGFLASDGHTIITQNEHSRVVAIDLATCRTVWELPDRAAIWQVGTGLLQADVSSDTVVSLRAAS